MTGLPCRNEAPRPTRPGGGSTVARRRRGSFADRDAAPRNPITPVVRITLNVPVATAETPVGTKKQPNEEPLMRKLVGLVVCLLALGVAIPVSAGAAVPAKKKAPVKLSGKVNKHGQKTVKGSSIEIEQDDFYFGPTFVKAKPGTTITVELKNEGKQQHTFTIDDQNIDQAVDPGKSSQVTVSVPATGVVTYYCRFHVALGMQGAVFTKATTAKAKPASKGSTSGGYGY